MIDLTKIDDIKALQNTLRNKPIHDPDVMKFLEQLCGWFSFVESDPNVILILEGRRQVLATLKTLLEHPAEDVQRVAKTIGV
jgi:hypothetical protein